jgi:hypothetical protein
MSKRRWGKKEDIDFSVDFTCDDTSLPLQRIPDIFPLSLHQAHVAPFNKPIVMKITGEESSAGLFKCYVYSHGARASCSHSNHCSVRSRWIEKDEYTLWLDRSGKNVNFGLTLSPEITFKFILDAENEDLGFSIFPCSCPIFMRLIRLVGRREKSHLFVFKIRDEDIIV